MKERIIDLIEWKLNGDHVDEIQWNLDWKEWDCIKSVLLGTEIQNLILRIDDFVDNVDNDEEWFKAHSILDEDEWKAIADALRKEVAEKGSV